MNDRSVEAVRAYWESHPLGTQYVKDPNLVPGTKEFYRHIRPWMNPYKFPEIMPRIEAEAMQLQDRHLLEIGCGMGFDSAEFLKRGVKVTATDLTPAAVRLARQHFELFGLQPEDVRVENVLDLSFPAETFDAVWATGVIHHTGDSRRAIAEIRRVLKPGGRAILSHFYRRPSWMQLISRLGRENIEFSDADPPVIDFMRERDVLDLFDGFEIERVDRDHYRALPIARQGWKAALYSGVFRPAYNLLARHHRNSTRLQVLGEGGEGGEGGDRSRAGCGRGQRRRRRRRPDPRRGQRGAYIAGLQLLVPSRFPSIDDVIFNTAGGALGIWRGWWLMPRLTAWLPGRRA